MNIFVRCSRHKRSLQETGFIWTMVKIPERISRKKKYSKTLPGLASWAWDQRCCPASHRQRVPQLWVNALRRNFESLSLWIWVLLSGACSGGLEPQLTCSPAPLPSRQVLSHLLHELGSRPTYSPPPGPCLGSTWALIRSGTGPEAHAHRLGMGRGSPWAGSTLSHPGWQAGRGACPPSFQVPSASLSGSCNTLGLG